MAEQRGQFNELSRAFGRIEGKLDSIEKTLENLNKNLCRNSDRVDVLEEGMATIKGQAIGAGMIAGLISSVIGIIVAVWAFLKKVIP